MLPLLAGASPVAAQETIPLYEDALGSYSWKVTTAEPRAQAYFNQGARLMISYAGSETRRSFEEAVRIDPDCAMCWWGIVWSMGPTFNTGGSVGGSMDRVQEAVERARAAAAAATPVERALIEAMAVRHGIGRSAPPTTRAPLDSAYAAALAKVYERFPHDPEVATLYADALMLLEPRRGAWPIEKPSVQLTHRVLEEVLAHDPRHPGACHAYVHATETTPKVVAAQRCADFLGAAIPGASHINHMPSHTYNRVGRWGDATLANLEARETDLRAERGEGFAIYPSHNLHMLFFSASMDGQGEVARTAAVEYGQYDGDGSIGFQALILARFGHFGRVLQLTTAPADLLPLGYWHFGRGLAHLREGRADSAAHHLAQLDSLAVSATDRHRFRVHLASDLLAIVGGILRGEILRAGGSLEEAIGAVEAAVVVENRLTYDEPEPIPFLARDYLGALLLEAGRPEEAERVYRAALEARPKSGWSLIGLEQAVRVQGRTGDADALRQEFHRAWARADVRLTASRF